MALATVSTPWYRMDNASVMYSAIQREDYSAIYRFSAFMDREVDPAALQRAVDRAMPRFPALPCAYAGAFSGTTSSPIPPPAPL